MAQVQGGARQRAGKARIDADMARRPSRSARAARRLLHQRPPSRARSRSTRSRRSSTRRSQRADKLIAKGHRRGKVYARSWQGGAGGRRRPSAAAAAAAGAGRRTRSTRFPSATRRPRARKQPKVTIVEFSDFQCPFCTASSRRSTSSTKDLRQRRARRVEEQPAAVPPQRDAGGDGRDGRARAGQVLGDARQAVRQPAGARRAPTSRSTPRRSASTWASSRPRSTTRRSRTRIKRRHGAGREVRRARHALLLHQRPQPARRAADRGVQGGRSTRRSRRRTPSSASGTPRGQLYAELTKDGKDKADAPPAAPQPGEPDAEHASTSADVERRAGRRAPRTRKVTIVEFSDFQCPFCSRVEPTIDQVMEEYKGKVRVVLAHLPLPFHNNAHARRRCGAGRQGAGQVLGDARQAVRATSRRSTARASRSTRSELGLNVDKFKAALDSGKCKETVEAELAEGSKIGARGTPSFFINGKFARRARSRSRRSRPRSTRRSRTAEALVAKGTPRRKVYDELMKDAKAEVAGGAGAPPAAAAGASRKPTPRSTRSTAGQRAVEGPEDGAGADRRVLRLPVPVLLARRADARADRGEVPGQGPHRVEQLPAAVPQQRGAGRRGRDGRARAGQVLGDARQAVRQPAGARPPEPREVRAGDRPRRGQVQGGPRLGQVQGRRPGRD